MFNVMLGQCKIRFDQVIMISEEESKVYPKLLLKLGVS